MKTKQKRLILKKKNNQNLFILKQNFERENGYTLQICVKVSQRLFLLD